MGFFSNNTNIVICIVVVMIIIFMIYSRINSKENFNNRSGGCRVNNMSNNRIERVVDIPNNNNNKVLKYFGSSNCPHSRKGSRAYNIITEFEDKYDDVEVQYYWSGEDNIDEFERASADYVPTITNCNYNMVELVLPENTDTTNMDDDELKVLLLENMYRQL